MFRYREDFLCSKLCKGHAEKLTPTGESFNVPVASIPLDATTKFSFRKIVHKLGKDDSSLMHTNTLSVVLKGSITTDMMSSKFKSFPLKNV